MKKQQNIFLTIIILLIIITFMSCRSKETAQILHQDSLVVAQDSAMTVDSLITVPYTDTVYLPGKVIHDTITKLIVLQPEAMPIIGNSIPDCPAPGLCKVDTLAGYYERRTGLAGGD